MTMRIYQQFLSYSVAIGSTAIALFLSLWLKPFLSPSIGAFFYIAIILSAWYGGFRAGMVAIVLSAFAIDYFFLSPLHQLWNISLGDTLRLGIFVLVSLIMNLLTSSFKNSKKQVEQLNQQLVQYNAEQLHQQIEQQRVLIKMIQRIRQSLNLQDILQTTVEEVRQFLQCDRALMFKIDPDYSGTILVESVDPAWNPISSNHNYDPCVGEEYIEPFKQGLVTAKSDIYTAEISPCHREMLIGLQVRANLVVPILQEKNLWGLLVVHHCAAPREWHNDEIELLRQLSAQASIAIQQADLFEQVKTESIRIQTIFNTSFDGIVILDREGKVLEANPRFYEMLGYTPEETVSLNVFDWDAHFTFEELHKFLHDSGFTSGVFETRHRRKDGSIYDVEISANLLEWQGEMMRFCACRDITERKQTQIALQELNTELEQRVIARTAELTEVNERLQEYINQVEDLYNYAPCGYHSLDAAGTIVMINDTELNWLGYTRDEILHKKKFVDLISPESKHIFYHNFPLLKKQGSIKNIEIQVLHKNGSIMWMNVNSTAIYDRDGNFLMSRSSLFDVSDRKQATQLLQQSESTLRSFFNSAVVPMGIVELHEGDILHIADNWAAAQFFHNTTAGMQNQFSSNLGASPATIDRWISYYQEAQRTQAPVRFEYLHSTNDGEFWLSGTVCPIAIKPNEYPRFSYIVEDITQRKLAEEILQQYERIISNTTDGIAMINRHYIYQIANQGYLNWCNKSAKEVIGNSPRNILGAELFDSFIKPLVDRCLTGEKIQYERWFDYPNLVPQFLSITYTPLRDISDNIAGVIVSLRDLTRLKQAEQMLELQAVITRNMAEGICLVRGDNGTIVYANPKFEQMFGYDPDELNGQHISIVNYATEPVIAEEVNQAIRTAVLQNGEFSYEVHNVKKDGTPFWCSATTSIFKHSDYGDVLVAVHQDITQRKEAEATLLQKSRQENLLWSMTQSIRQSLDLNAILNTAVTEVRETLQSDRAVVYCFNADWSGDFVVESVGEDWVKLVGADIQKVCEDVYLQETQGGRFKNHETFAIADINAAGLHACHVQLLEQFQAQAYLAVPIFSGEVLWGLLIIYQNTTPRHWQSWEVELLQQIASQLAIAIQQSNLYEQLQIELQERQQAEATIREAERRWRSLLDNVELIVVGLDRSGNINYVNPFFLELTGYTYAEVLEKNWFENFVPRAHQQSIQTVFSEVLTDNAYPYYRNAILTKSGEERFIGWNNTMLQDSMENIIGTISIGEDITERQKIERIKDEFIGIVSHELRTPLTAIQMSLGLIKTGVYDQKPEKARRMIEIALLDTNRLVNLVNDILDLERLDSGRAVFEKTLCQAADLIQQAIDGIQAIATQQQISLIVTPTDVEVWAAADAIIQTLTNLLSNAIKFSPPQSAIYLSVESQIDGVQFQVSDRGRGIPTEKLELIFARFQQVDGSDSREKGGTGLGLAICRSIIERHGGKIWAESSLGAGSTFFFTLPSEKILSK